MIEGCPTCGSVPPASWRGINLSEREISRDGVNVTLTPLEFRLAFVLVQGRGTIVRIEKIRNAIKKDDLSSEPTRNLVKVKISQLRDKLRPLRADIVSQWGVGWGLVVHA